MQPAIPVAFTDLFVPRRYKVFWGGRGSAKSWSIARTLVSMAARKKLRVLCAREFQVSIADSVHKLLCDQIEALGLSAFYEITDTAIRCKTTKSEFRFVGLKTNIRNIKGAESVDIVWVEEAESVSAASWNILIPTIRKTGSEIWISFNPDQETDPTFQRFVKTPPPNAIVIKVGWQDNPHISQELLDEKDHLKRVDIDAYNWVWEGQFRQRSAAQVLGGKWSIDRFETPLDADGPYFGADWGFSSSPTTLIKMWIVGRGPKTNGTLLIEHESYKVNLGNDDIATYWNSTVPGIGKNVVRADAARPETISHVAKHGLNVIAADKWPGSVEDGISVLRSFEHIVVHERCKHAVQEARLWSYKTDRLTGAVLEDLIKENDHIWDAVRYGLSPIIKRSGGGRGMLDFIAQDIAKRQQKDAPP